jgi:hypothetical protein
MVDAVQRIDLLVQSGGGAWPDSLSGRLLAVACAT